MKPTFKIIADEKNITEVISQRLVSLNITDETGLVSDKVEILLDNRDSILEIPKTGANLQISIGYEDKTLNLMGSYIVDQIECFAPPSQMRITAKTSNTKIREIVSAIKAPKSRSWHKYTLIGIINKIAQEHKLQALIDSYFKKIYINHIDQTDESDISFLQRLAIDYGAMLKPANSYLIFTRKGRAISLSGKPMPLIEITKNEISRWSLNIAERGKFGKVIARWHNFATGKEEKISTGNGEPSYNIRFSFATEQRTLEAAKAKLAEFQRGIAKLNIAMMGNPALSSENRLSVKDIRYLQDKEWIISNVNHNLDNQGYISQITANLLAEGS